MASVLTRTLLETGQEIPEFLQIHVPEEGKDLKFEADSDFDPEEDRKGADGDEWGSGGGFGGNAGGDDGDMTKPVSSIICRAGLVDNPI